MFRQMLVLIGILLLAFGSGVGMGLFLGGGNSAAGASNKTGGGASSGFFSDPAAEDREQANSLLSDRIRELEKELADQKKDQSAIHVNPVAFFKRYQDRIGLRAFDNQLKLTPEMVELLGLTKEEQQAVEQHLRQIANELEKIDDANTVLVKQTANSVTYAIAPSPDGKALKDKLSSLLSGDVTPFRAELLMEPRQFDSFGPFSQFDGQKKEIEVTWTEQNGSLLYTVKQSSANGTMTSAGSRPSLPQYEKYLPTKSSP